MVNLYALGHPEPEECNSIQYCLCINPNCTQPKRPNSEAFCQACGSNLILKNRYRVIDVLIPREKHQIGNSRLYDAIDITDNKKSKVIKVLYTDNEEAIIRFDLSADVLMKHWFEGIPKVDKGGYFPIEFPHNPIPAYCLVMEKIEGMNLQQWLVSRNHSPIDEEKAIDWLQQLAKILSKLHKEDFYHRDIKPSNIMLRNNLNELVLIDLDTVKAITEASQKGIDVTRIGTPGYQAPEQEDGKAVPQSDFYALGHTFVHLLTGKHPKDLPKKSAGKLNWKQYAKKLQVFGPFASFIDKLVAWSPDDRPRNAQEIVQRLDEIKQILKVQKQVKQFLTFNQLKQWLTFKNIFGLIVMLIVLFVVYKGIVPPRPDLGNTQINPTPTPTSDSRCKFSQGETVKDDNNLAKDIKSFLLVILAATQDSKIQQVNLRDVRQTNCDVIIVLTLKNNNELDDDMKNKIKQLIKNNFDYVGNIEVVKPQ
ncbi:protein kinase domain-containing protein [Anabaena sp. WFMT]|uniref:protein kinase domain-containing protein n=1 Tax=Anabaena sp. WFMT TaxID=3449730 RepID=UPI003F1EDA81